MNKEKSKHMNITQLRRLYHNPQEHASPHDINLLKQKHMREVYLMLTYGIIGVTGSILWYTFHSPTSGGRRGYGLDAILISSFYLSIPYAMYRYINFNKYLARLLRVELVRNNPELYSYDYEYRKKVDDEKARKIKKVPPIVYVMFVGSLIVILFIAGTK